MNQLTRLAKLSLGLLLLASGFASAQVRGTQARYAYFSVETIPAAGLEAAGLTLELDQKTRLWKVQYKSVSPSPVASDSGLVQNFNEVMRCRMSGGNWECACRESFSNFNILALNVQRNPRSPRTFNVEVTNRNWLRNDIQNVFINHRSLQQGQTAYDISFERDTTHISLLPVCQQRI